MIGEIALAIEMGADAVDIGKTIHPHPTLGESLGMAAEVAHGSCTDLPPQRVSATPGLRNGQDTKAASAAFVLWGSTGRRPAQAWERSHCSNWACTPFGAGGAGDSRQ